MSETTGAGKAHRAARPLLWWDLAVGLVLAGMAGIAAFQVRDGSPLWAEGASTGSRLALLMIPLVLLGLAYAGFVRSALCRAVLEEPGGVSSVVAPASLILLLCVAAFAEPLYAMLQTIAYPMVWTIAHRYRDAVLWSAAVAASIGLGMFAGIAVADVRSGLLSALVSAPASFVFAVAMGTWITRIHQRGEDYRELAERLRATQTEIAALSEQAGAAAERERLARELHDTLTQTLAGLVMLTEQASRALEAGDTGLVRDRLARVGEASRDAALEARALVATSQPLSDGGLEQTVERVAARFAADTGMRVRCELERLNLDRERQVVMLRAAQEGLANARKHSRAASVRVSLDASPEGAAVLVVEDDGVGPARDIRTGGGFGLAGLAERVRHVGGEVSFGPREPGGSRLVVSIPAAEGSAS